MTAPLSPHAAVSPTPTQVRRSPKGPLHPWVLAFAFVAAAALDVFTLAHGLVKIEIANAIPMEVHVALRDGWWLLSSDPQVFAEAPAYWPFQLLFLLTPSLEKLAPLLALIHVGFTVLIGREVAKRFGSGMGWSYGALHLSMPVYWILNTHVISTYFAPLLAPLYFLAVYDLMQPSPSRGAERRAWWFGAALILLHRGNIVYFPAVLLAQLFSRRRPTVPTLLGTLALLIPSLHRVLRDGLETSVTGAGPAYDTLWEFIQRFVFAESGIESFIVSAWAFYGLTAFAVGYLLLTRPPSAKPFLLFLPCLPLLWFTQPESTVPSEFFLLITLLITAQQLRVFQWALNGYVLAFVANQAYMVFTVAPLPNAHFLSLSSTRSRSLMFDGLNNEFNITATEMETVAFRSEHYEEAGIVLPAMLPGTSYYVDRLLDPLPAGGSRCFLVADETFTPPNYGPTTRTVHVPPWNMTSWQQTEPCPGTIRVDRGRPVFLDLSSWELVTFPEASLP